MVRRMGTPPLVAETKPQTLSPINIPTIAPIAAPAAVPAVITKKDLPFNLEEVGKIGGDVQGKIAAVTSRITGVAKTSDMDEVGKLLTDTIMAAKGYDPKNLFKSGLFGMFKAKAAGIKMKFDSVDETVDRLVAQVDQRIAKFRGRVTDLNEMKEANHAYHDSLTGQIVYITERADWMEANQPVADPADPMSASFVQDWLTVITFARKRADDLRRAQVLAQQQAAQIDQMITNSIALSQKFGDIKVTTIPAMQQTFTLYVINMEQKKGAEFADQIDALNNDVIQRNAATLGQNTTAIHTALTRSNISLETLQVNHDAIINSLTEVKRINDEMKTRLASEAPQLERLSEDLAKRLSEQ